MQPSATVDCNEEWRDGSEAAPPGVKRSPRERMLSVAKHLFATQGFEHTSTITITRGAQTSETQLVKNFGSKEGLLEAVFDEDSFRVWENLRQLDIAGLSPLERLRLVLKVAVEHLDNDADAKTLLVTEHGRVRRKFRHDLLVSRGYLEACALVDCALEQMCVMGQLRPNLQPRILRSCLFGMTLQIWRDQLQAPDNRGDSSEHIIAMTDALLAAFVPQSVDNASAV